MEDVIKKKTKLDIEIDKLRKPHGDPDCKKCSGRGFYLTKEFVRNDIYDEPSYKDKINTCPCVEIITIYRVRKK